MSEPDTKQGRQTSERVRVSRKLRQGLWQTTFIYLDVNTLNEVSLASLCPYLPPPDDSRAAVTLINSWRSKGYKERTAKYLYADYSPAKPSWTRLLETKSVPEDSVTEWVLQQIDAAVEGLRIRERLTELLARYGARFIRVKLENYTGTWGAMQELPGTDAFFHNLTFALFTVCEQFWPDPTVTDYEYGAPLSAELSVLVGSIFIEADPDTSKTHDLPRQPATSILKSKAYRLIQTRSDLNGAASRRRPPLVLLPSASPLRHDLVKLVQGVLVGELAKSVRQGLVRHKTNVLLFRPEAADLANLLAIPDVESQLRTKVQTFARYAPHQHDPTVHDRLLDAGGHAAARFVVSLLPHLRYSWLVTRPDIARRETKPPDDKTSDLTLPSREAWAVVQALKEKLLPRVSDQDLAALSSAIRAIKEQGKLLKESERAAFVEDVNLLLAATNSYIELTKDGTQEHAFRLVLKNGSVQILPASGDACGLNNPFSILRRS
ncbi:MAG: hypothetical protein F9K17_11040 [Phycisphaerae bacterium]|nr:MAG: hypothetical protein F9K17_11040 [Phycisphaerae bacterium]